MFLQFHFLYGVIAFIFSVCLQFHHEKGALFCTLCKRTNHDLKDCFWRCKRCKRPNHFEKDCWFNNQKEEANFSEKEAIKPEELLFFSSQTPAQDQQTWFIDSGCSSHMSNDKSLFFSLDESFKSVVYLGDGNTKSIERKGTVEVTTHPGHTKFITDVQWVPQLAQNLLSVRQLIEKGYSVQFHNGECEILDGASHRVASARMSTNRVFSLNIGSSQHGAFTCKHGCTDEALLWHHRLSIFIGKLFIC